MEKTINYLTTLGLTQKEAKLYIALIEIGSGTAYAVAKQSGLKRPTVYVLLDDLRKKGLVKKIPHAKNQVFIAKDPEEFFAELEEKMYQAKRALPALLTKYNRGNITSHLFEGKHEMEQALKYRRNELAGQELLAFYGAPSNGKKIPEIYYQHAKSLQGQNTKVRVFAPDDAALKRFRAEEGEYGQEARYLPSSKYLPRVSVEVGKNFSKIFLHTASQALVIEGQEFSDFMKQVFELLWEKKVNN